MVLSRQGGNLNRRAWAGLTAIALTVFFGSISTASDNPIGNFVRQVVEAVGISPGTSGQSQAPESVAPSEESSLQTKTPVTSCPSGEVLVDEVAETGQPGCMTQEEIERLEDEAWALQNEGLEPVAIGDKSPVYVDEQGEPSTNAENGMELEQNLLEYATGIAGTLDYGVLTDQSPRVSGGTWIPKLYVSNSKLQWPHRGEFSKEHSITGFFTELETGNVWPLVTYDFVPPSDPHLDGGPLLFPFVGVPTCLPGTFYLELSIPERPVLTSGAIPAFSDVHEPGQSCWNMEIQKGSVLVAENEVGYNVEIDFTIVLPKMKLGQNASGHFVFLELGVTNPQRAVIDAETLLIAPNLYSIRTSHFVPLQDLKQGKYTVLLEMEGSGLQKGWGTYVEIDLGDGSGEWNKGATGLRY